MPEDTQAEVCAWHYATRQAVRLRWHEGIVTHLEPAESPPPQDVWIAPPLFDAQINGYSGIDFQQDNLTQADLLIAVRRLRASGCARFLLTLVTDDRLSLTARLRQLRALRGQSAAVEFAIAGWHVEGPFLSNQPGFHGAHRPGLTCSPEPEHILELRTITGDDPLMLTLSPERPRALNAIALAASLGIRVSLGHTNASAEIL